LNGKATEKEERQNDHGFSLQVIFLTDGRLTEDVHIPVKIYYDKSGALRLCVR
jgi:hypothetical protein